MTYDPAADPALDEQDPDTISEEEWRSIEERDLCLPDDDACAFLTVDTDPTSPPCPAGAVTTRTVEGVPMLCCPTHRDRGGILHPAARRALVLALVARSEIAATRVGVTDDGERVTFARFCERCGTGLFAGNTSGFCAECFEPALVPAGGLADLAALDARNHAADLRAERHDGSWRDR